MKRKIVGLLLAVTMTIGMLAGCGSTPEAPSSGAAADTEKADTEAAGSASEASSGSGEEAEGSGAEDLTALRGNTAPTEEEIQLVNTTLNDTYLGDVFSEVIPNNYSAYPWKEEVTLDVWMANNSILSSVCPDLNDHRVFNQLEELTGIKLNFIVPALGEETTEFNLMIASGELPDIIIGADRYVGGIAAGVNEGAYMDLTDVLDEYMPNYAAWRNSDEERRKTTITDEGVVGGVYGIAPYNEWCWFGLLIKQEALDKTGLPVPETIDELHDFLVACKEQGYDQPLNYGSTYGQIFTGIINGAYGVWDWMFVDDNGKAAWGPGQEKAKEYLTTMQSWYEEGLLNTDWATADFNQRMAEAVSGDCAVMMDSPDTMWGYWKEDNDIDFVAALNPVLTKGEQSRQTYRNFKKTGSVAAVTTQCKNVEAACAFLDFAYTKKGWEVYNYGTYGDVHLIDENGLPYFFAEGLMYNDPEGQPVSNLIWKYRIHDGADIRDEHNSNPLITAEGSYSGDIRDYWTKNMDSTLTMPPVTFTPEEAAREGELGTILSTMRNEYFSKIIMGQLPVDAYDEFLANAKAQGMDEFIALWQAALDRYNAR